MVEDAVRPELLRGLDYLLRHAPAAHDQLSAHFVQVRVQNAKRIHQKCHSRRAGVRSLQNRRVEHKQRNDRLRLGNSFVKCDVIVEPEVAPEPYDQCLVFLFRHKY